MRRPRGSRFCRRQAVPVAALVLAACQSSEAPHQTPPPPPPGTQHVVFDMQLASGGPRNIYAIVLDGTGLVQLTSDSADHHGPTVHDSLLVFGSVRQGGVVIASLRTGSGDVSPGLVGAGDAPALSPDGATLAYLSQAGPTPRVWLSHVDGTAAQRFAPAQAGWDGAIETHPAWSPAGDRLAYVSTRAGNAAIYVGVVDGAAGSAALLTGGPAGASVEPAWSPDGTQIVFTSNRDGPTDLYLVTVSTGAVMRLTSVGSVGQPAWLSDGRIVFTRWVGGVAGLAWLDPTHPTELNALALAGDAQHAAPYP